jgi:predicted RNA binding protein YcfA (HicA-like mRNA interferase family)
MPALPRAEADRHLKAFERAGWRLDRITGSHYILVKDGVDFHLTIPYHRGQIVKLGLLKGLIRDAGLTNDAYLDLFQDKKRRS